MKRKTNKLYSATVNYQVEGGRPSSYNFVIAGKDLDSVFTRAVEVAKRDDLGFCVTGVSVQESAYN